MTTFTQQEVFNEMYSARRSGRSFSPAALERTVSRLVLGRFERELRDKAERASSRRSRRLSAASEFLSSRSSCDTYSNSSLDFSVNEFLSTALDGTATTSFHTASASFQGPQYENSPSSNSTTFPNSSSSEEERHPAPRYDLPFQSLNESRTDAFNHEFSTLQTRSYQLLKAITYASSIEETAFSRARIEAEKMLLLTHQKINLIVDDFVKDAVYTEVELDKGQVEISRIQLATDLNKCMDAKHYFFCLLQKDTQMVHSEVAVPDGEGRVFFDGSYKFSSLSPDFRIKLEVYMLKFRTLSPLKRKFLFCGGAPDVGDCFVMRDSLFKPILKTTITMKNINRRLDISWLRATITGKVSTEGGVLTAWADVSRNGGLFWSKRWCVLEGSRLTYWNYSTEKHFNPPISEIELKECRNVRLASRFESARPRTIVLELKDSECFIAFMLAADYNEWKRRLEELHSTLNAWNTSGFD